MTTSEGEEQSPSRVEAGLTSNQALSRRRFLYGTGGLVGLAAAGFVGFEWPHQVARRPTKAAPTTTDLGTVQRAAVYADVDAFVTRPDLQPQRVKITHYRPLPAESTPEFIFLAPKGYVGPAPGQPGLMIIDRRGRLVWFRPVPPSNPAFDFNVQRYHGNSVLTWWQGKVVLGTGYGTGYWADSAYGHVHQVTAGKGLQADLHELNFTSAGTALVTAYRATTTDLSALGGPRQGPVLASHAQEIDLVTGKVLLDWDSLEHVGVSESLLPLPQKLSKDAPFDYFHINSVSEMPNGNLLISARNTWTLYEVDRASGKVLWRLNGKKSDFTMGPGSRFYWQHDSRAYPDGRLTVFDDGASPAEEKQARGLLLDMDIKAKHVSLRRAYLHPAGFLAANQGSVQRLPDGRIFVGWGNQPYFSEFAPDGALLMDGQLPLNIQSYRTFTQDWVGRPTEPPAVAVRVNPAGSYMVYASWNGATEIETWTILAGAESSSLQPVGSQKYDGFETAVAVSATGPKFQAVALDSNGREIGRSAVVTAPKTA